MSLFSPNAFLLGTIITVFMVFGANMIYVLICKAFKVRVQEFAIFFTAKLPLHSKTVGKTKYILGWIPYGGYVKILGMYVPEEERAAFPEEDLPFALFPKPWWVKALLQTAQLMMIGLLLTLMLLLLSGPQTLLETVAAYSNLMAHAVQAMFTDAITHDQFRAECLALMGSHSPLAFALAIFASLSLLMYVFDKVMRMAALGSEKGTKILNVLGWLLFLPLLWIMFWKIPSFTFSFFSWAEIGIHAMNALAATLFTGVVLHILTIFVAKRNFHGK